MAAYTWVGTTSDWGTGSNWSPVAPAGGPIAGDDLTFNNAANCTTGTTARNCATINTTGYTGILTIGSSTAGTLRVTGNITLGNSVGHISGSANLIMGGTINRTLDVATGVTIPNLRVDTSVAITVTLSRTTVATNFSKTGSAALTDCTFSASTAGTELRITNYTTHTFNLGATLMGTNTTLRFMGPSCTFDSFNIGGNVVLDTGATLTPLAVSTLFTTIRFVANTTLNFSGGTLVLPAITNSNKLGTGFTFNAGTAHTINMGSNSIDWVVCNNGPTVTLQANLVINKAINQGISSPTFTGGFNLIVKESLATSSNANWYGLNISGGGKIVYQSSPTGFIGTGYISGTTLFITSVIQGTLGFFSIIHVPSSTTTSYTQIDNCTTFPTAGTGQYTVQTSMTVGSVGSPVTIYGFGIGFMGTNGLVEIDAGSNAVYLHAISLPSTTSELRYLSTNSGIFDGSKAWVLNSFGSTESTIDFQGQSSTTKFINRFSPGYNVGGQINLKSNLYVNDLECLNSSGVGQIGGPYTLYVLRNFSVGNSGLTRVLAPNVRLEGPLNANFTCNNLFGNVVINKSGGAVVTVTQNFTYGYSTPTTFTYTAGQVNFGATTMTIAGGCTIISPSSVGNFSFNNVTVNAGIAYGMQNTMRILGTLLCNGSATFTGTHGWTTNVFTCSTANSTLTFQNINANPNAEYITTASLNIIGTSTQRITLQAAGSASFNGTITPVGQLNVTSGTAPTVGMTISQATNQSPAGLIGLLPNRPVITGGGPSAFTISPSATQVITSIFAMRAGFKAKFTLLNNGTATQNVAYATTQDIDSDNGQTIFAFGSNRDDVSTNVSLFRTLNWGPLIAPSGSVYYTWVD